MALVVMPRSVIVTASSVRGIVFIRALSLMSLEQVKMRRLVMRNKVKISGETRRTANINTILLKIETIIQVNYGGSVRSSSDSVSEALPGRMRARSV